MAKQKYKFERLTPIDNMDLDVYEEAIDYVFSNSDVKNVAISGAYSAGKSSVLASYKKKHDELRFLHISLAHFKSTDQESDAEVKESTLEGKILNQLIHQIPSEKIPQTNFRVKKTVSSKSIATSTIGAVLFLISILHLLFFSVWKNYIGVLPVSLIKSILMPSTHPYALIVDGIIILVLLSLSVYKLIRIQREKNIFRKLNIKGNEIEIFEKSDDSYFDKYLNEVLYLFENSDADVIVFEDMDRFNTNGIFERLREVNTLANIQLNKENEKVLRFFYLLRDDIFADKYLSGYDLRRQNDNDLSEFITKHLSGSSKDEYLHRRQMLKEKLDGNSDKLSQEILRLEQNIVELNDKHLHQIITRENIDSVFSISNTNEIGITTNFNDIKGSEYFDLLKYIIRNGYIDESYADYMTYFYENSLSRVDKTFLRSVTDKKAKEYTYKLKNPQLVVSRLRLADFGQEETLNFDLLTYLLKSSRKDYIERFIDQLKQTNNFDFVGAYFDLTAELPNYIKHLNIGWPEMFSTALSEQSLTEAQIRKYSIFSLYYSDDDIIKLINKNNCLSDYISEAYDYLTIDNPNIDRLIHCFMLLDVRFKGFDYDKIHKELFYAVYQKSLYVITDENLSLIQKEILNEKNEDTLLHKNYSLLCLHSESALTKYVNHNINEYFDVMLKMSSGIICDDENVAVVVLNNSDLTTEHKQAYIHSLETKITSIKAIKDSSLWAALLDANIVQYSECNIMDCFNAVKLNSSVVSYINQCDIDLDFSKTEYDENTKGALFDSVITCSDIGNSKYAQILSSLNFVYDDFDISGISDDKIAILIDKKIIRMTTDNLSFIRNNYPDQKFHFIHINMKEYVDTVGKTLFSQNELVEILTWDINDDLKISLLKMSKEPISIIGKGYSTAVCLHILSNNFAESDLPSLFSSFEQWDDSIQEKIFDHAVNNISCIIDNQDSIPTKLIKSLLNSESVSRDEKLDLFAAIMPGLCVDDIQSILILLNLTDYLKIFDMRSRPKFEINNESEKLLAAFKECHLIDSYEESTTKAGYYKVARPKATKALSKEPSTVT